MSGALPEREGRTHASSDFTADLARLRDEGWRVDEIWPADEPHTAVLSQSGGERMRLTVCSDSEPPSSRLAEFRPDLVLTRGSDDAGEGRAGMRYRDLLPVRLGGRYIASHISIAEGGPVDDWVHYHGVAFQMIYVRRGWVKLVYEGQGEPFVMEAGDLVLQPPYIRHRVLESSPGLEVIEIGCPALHKTYSDHDLQLPHGFTPDRMFSGQQFLRHVAAVTPWIPFRGGEAQETGMKTATAGLAEVRTLRGGPVEFDGHDGELVFGFVLDGSACLEAGGSHAINSGDAFAIPPSQPWAIGDASADFRLLHVTTAHMPEVIPVAPSKSA
jgi:quercetin dioxygenase-like cupin family protein